MVSPTTYGLALIDDVMFDCKIGYKDFFNNKYKAKATVEARKEGIVRLHNHGFRQTEISLLMGMHYDSVRYWLHPRHREMRINRGRAAYSVRPKIQKRRKNPVEEQQREWFFNQLAAAGLSPVRKGDRVFKRLQTLKLPQILELLLLRYSNRRHEAMDLAVQLGVDRNYARNTALRLGLPRFKSGPIPDWRFTREQEQIAA